MWQTLLQRLIHLILTTTQGGYFQLKGAKTKTGGLTSSKVKTKTKKGFVLGQAATGTQVITNMLKK
jgi:hypothetical protein